MTSATTATNYKSMQLVWFNLIKRDIDYVSAQPALSKLLLLLILKEPSKKSFKSSKLVETGGVVQAPVIVQL